MTTVAEVPHLSFDLFNCDASLADFAGFAETTWTFGGCGDEASEVFFESCWTDDSFGGRQVPAVTAGRDTCMVPTAEDNAECSPTANEASTGTPSSITNTLFTAASGTAPQFQAASDLLDPEDGGSIVTCSSTALPKLQLNYTSVIREWELRGNFRAVDRGTAAQDSVTLCLPPPAPSAGGLPSYMDVLPTGIGIARAGTALLTHGGGGLRLDSRESTDDDGLTGAVLEDIMSLAEDDFCAAEEVCRHDGFLAANIMPAIPRPSLRSQYSMGSLQLSSIGDSCGDLSAYPQSLACIPAKTTGNSEAARAACLSRYKLKKLNRQTGKIRYEMRKVNAEKRPRIKGRFVKRADLAAVLEKQLESLSPRSQGSSASDATWA